MAHTGVATYRSVLASASVATPIIEIASFFEFVLPKMKSDCTYDELQPKDESGGPISFSAVRMIARIAGWHADHQFSDTRRYAGGAPCGAT